MSSVEADFDRLALLDDEGWTANNHYHSSLLKFVPQSCEEALEIGVWDGGVCEGVGEALQASSCAGFVGGDDSGRAVAIDAVR
jgi:hypothetical protein